ncbi:MAG TPA: tetratricopeptide repeat protein, partial [Desulfuromonadaceae bacterium]
MSILADLLSKNKWGDSQSGKEIPPTLARAQRASVAKKRIPKKRYIAVAIVSLAVVGAGLVMTSRVGRLPLSRPVKYPLPPQPAPSVAQPSPPAAPPAPQQAAAPAAPATPPPAAEPRDKVQATFETRPLPRTAVARHSHTKARPAAVSMTGQKELASRELQRLAAKTTTAGTENRREAVVPPPRVDTEARSALLYAARSAEQAGDWRLALANYRHALELDPENYKIMSNAAAALNNLGMFDEGAREARQALTRKPGYVPALINAAIAYSSKGNNREALRLFSDACAADPGNKNLAINLGILQERMGKLDEASATYRSLAGAGDPLALMG